MMDEIADRGMPPRGRVREARVGIPEPLAGGVGTGGSDAGAPAAEDRDGDRGQHAGETAAAQDVRPVHRHMRVLVTGGRGLIGGALAAVLRARGHDVILATRDGDGGVALDFQRLPDINDLASVLTGIDVIVNAVGIFREGEQSFDALHVKAPHRLLEAARCAGVRRFVQISTLGADSTSSIPYFQTKGIADENLLASTAPDGIVVRPSLVFAPGGASTRWFAMLAVLPITPLPEGGRQAVQPVHLDDLAQAVARLVEAGPPGACVDAVGPRALRLRDYLQLFKNALAGGSGFATLPAWLAHGAASLAGLWPGAPFDRQALAMLERGNVAAPDGMRRWRGEALRDPTTFVDSTSGMLRVSAWLGWLVPAMRGSLATLWIVTALVSLWGYPREDSLALLARTGLQGAWATAALWSAGLLDLLLGLATLLPRWRPRVYALQAALVATYTVIISVWLPEQWLHPYGPVLKNLPLLTMIACLWALDRGHGPHPR